MKQTFNLIVGLTLVLGLVLSCKDKPKDGRTDTYSSGAISFASDESFGPIIDEQKTVFEAIYPKAKVKPIYTNEVDAVKMLLDNKVWLAITSRRFTAAEEQALKNKDFAPRVVPLAYDGLALIVNNANPDTCITLNDIKRILGGEATAWKDINPASKLGKLDVVFDNAKSSTVRYCVDSLLSGKLISSPNIEAVNKSEQVIDYVSKHENAIGIIGSNWLNDKRDTTNVTFNKAIRVMSVSRMETATPMNSWKPYQYYLLNGNYPLVRTIYALLNDPRNGLPWGFAHFIESPKGQMIILKSGLLPVNGQIEIRTVNVSGE